MQLKITQHNSCNRTKFSTKLTQRAYFLRTHVLKCPWFLSPLVWIWITIRLCLTHPFWNVLKHYYDILPWRKVSVKIVKCREYMELVKESIVCSDTKIPMPIPSTTIGLLCARRKIFHNQNQIQPTCIKIILLHQTSRLKTLPGGSPLQPPRISSPPFAALFLKQNIFEAEEKNICWLSTFPKVNKNM